MLFPYLSPHVISGLFIYTVEYILTLGCVEGSTYGVIKCSLQSETEETDRVYHAWASNLAEIRSLWAHTLETQCTFEPL